MKNHLKGGVRDVKMVWIPGIKYECQENVGRASESEEKLATPQKILKKCEMNEILELGHIKSSGGFVTAFKK